MTENERIYHLRKVLLKMTLADFGQRLGVGKSAISAIENGINRLSDQMAVSICREFGVSSEWLRDGVGEPFPPKSREQEFSDLMDSVANEPEGSLKVRLLRALARMEPGDWEYMEKLTTRLLGEENKQ